MKHVTITHIRREPDDEDEIYQRPLEYGLMASSMMPS